MAFDSGTSERPPLVQSQLQIRLVGNRSMSCAWQRACCAAICLLLLTQGALAQKKVLVLTGDDSIEKTHSTFLSDLKDSGFSLDIKSHKDSELKLRDYDNWLYDSLLLLAPTATSKQTPSSSPHPAPLQSHHPPSSPAGFGGKINSKEILEFVDAGRNLLLVAEPGSGDAIRSLAAESGVDLDDKNTAVYDHFHYQAAGGVSDHTLVTSTITGPSPIVPDKLPVSSRCCVTPASSRAPAQAG
jgi:oligosaccharyltransferase complex subunit beta